MIAFYYARTYTKSTFVLFEASLVLFFLATAMLLFGMLLAAFLVASFVFAVSPAAAHYLLISQLQTNYGPPTQIHFLPKESKAKVVVWTHVCLDAPVSG